MEHLRFKIAPSPGIENMVKNFLPSGAEITISSLPVHGISATLDSAARLAGEGYRVVPHLPARMIPSISFLRNVLGSLTRSDIDRILVMAGDGAPEGPYIDSLHLMEDLTEFGGGTFKLGIVGHPEPHPHLPDSILLDALLAKQHLAADLTTQVCFDAGILRRYLERLRKDGIVLPVWASAPCPLKRDELIGAVSRTGVGASFRKISRMGPLAGGHSKTAHSTSSNSRLHSERNSPACTSILSTGSISRCL
ncbi:MULTISPECIES: methylenetetrahydrofolate reductase [Arthrobacter]|uniref:Methylenetetrahydrofolate reductase n=1 Tax=Arthrobacter terricola TaxID=2547396 RepID=A0A4R5KPD4_9MICC|nr:MULTISPECIES: methylenetetrahydrofolate reductase [Arthrobacter]MBT8160960.1 methylenetetrahydrofolate reductase [Arthrobacter sp. GN70]TDF96825.1 methylenetetrahydrofolate reductase [Arthrobacter terricola]